MNTLEPETVADIRATAAAFNKRNGWGIDTAIALAREVLTDANAHEEVRMFDARDEMLVALQLFVRSCEDGGVSMADLSAAAYDKARAAIAKATRDSR